MRPGSLGAIAALRLVRAWHENFNGLEVAVRVLWVTWAMGSCMKGVGLSLIWILDFKKQCEAIEVCVPLFYTQCLDTAA